MAAPTVESDRNARTRQLRRADATTTRGRPQSLPITLRHKIFFVAVAVIGARWTVVAFFHQLEPVNAVWIVVAAGCAYIIGFRFYARLMRSWPAAITPPPAKSSTTAPTTYRPAGGIRTPLRRIAGAGPLVGPVLAADGLRTQQHLDCRRRGAGGCPGLYLVLWISVRRRGHFLGQMVRDRRHRQIYALVGIRSLSPCDRGAGAGGRAGPGQSPWGASSRSP